MKTKLFVLFLAVIFLAGCATTTKKNNAQIQQLQDRINYLESERDKKEMAAESKDKDIYVSYDYDVDLSGESSAKKDIGKNKLSVKEAQAALKNSGFYKGPIDGKYGPKTKKAIKEFQKANGLKADGMVGKQTARKLSLYLK
jgi:peptidoglycan hydrolase-like protein with peptidoglycan-binding domain